MTTGKCLGKSLRLRWVTKREAIQFLRCLKTSKFLLTFQKLVLSLSNSITNTKTLVSKAVQLQQWFLPSYTQLSTTTQSLTTCMSHSHTPRSETPPNPMAHFDQRAHLSNLHSPFSALSCPRESKTKTPTRPSWVWIAKAHNVQTYSVSSLICSNYQHRCRKVRRIHFSSTISQLLPSWWLKMILSIESRATAQTHYSYY